VKKATVKSAELDARTIPIKDLVPTYARETNPNRMSDEQFASLVALIKAEGFMQSILVSPIPGSRGKFKILDGHHRFWACQEAGRGAVLAVIKPASESLGAAVGLGLNYIRGELDLSVSGLVMQQVMEDTSWTVDQLSLLTGFPQSEIDALTAQAHSDADEMLEDVSAAMPEGDEELEGSAKPYVLEIEFSDRALYQLARRKLRKAGGSSKDLAVGLLAVLGEDGDA